MNELLRLWKLATLAAGIALLIVGSFYYEAPHWDIPVSIIMALVAYVTAPWSLRVMVERRWRLWPLMILVGRFIPTHVGNAHASLYTHPRASVHPHAREER